MTYISQFIDLASARLSISSDNLCKQSGPRSCLAKTKCHASCGSKLFDTHIVFLKEILKTLIDLSKTKTAHEI